MSSGTARGSVGASTASELIYPSSFCYAFVARPKLVAPLKPGAYITPMTEATRPDGDQLDWRERAFDLARGIAAYCDSALVAGLARVIAKHPEADISNAFNHK